MRPDSQYARLEPAYLDSLVWAAGQRDPTLQFRGRPSQARVADRLGIDRRRLQHIISGTRQAKYVEQFALEMLAHGARE